MNLSGFLLRASWINVVFAALTGSISGGCSVFLIAFINNTISSNSSATNQLIWGFSGLAFMTLLTSLISQFLLVNLSQEAVYKLRLRLSGLILGCPLRHLEELGANRLLATLTDDIQAISNAVFDIPLLCINIALIFGCLVYLFWLSGAVFLVTVTFLAIAMAIVQLLITKAEGLFKLSRNEQDRLFKNFRAITDGIKELKLHTSRREAFLTEELQATARLSRDYKVASLRILAIATSLGDLLFFILIGLLIFALPKQTTISTTVLSGYVLTITYLLRPLQSILQILPAFSQAKVALQKIETLGLSLASNVETISTKSKLPPVFNTIELRSIVHAYHTEQEESNFTIGPIDLNFYPNELVFIVGGNGSGKSTLAKLITGLYIPEAGEILLDNQQITDKNRESYRQLFATVFADFYLFERILGINLNNLDAQAQEYLMKLHLEHKVQVKEGILSTTELSQGQRKRLALLTAYLEDRPVYLFDEWASDQDPFFREIFYKQLLPELKHQGKTVMVISHDDRYFHLADRVIKLEYGKLVEK